MFITDLLDKVKALKTMLVLMQLYGWTEKELHMFLPFTEDSKQEHVHEQQIVQNRLNVQFSALKETLWPDLTVLATWQKQLATL